MLHNECHCAHSEHLCTKLVKEIVCSWSQNCFCVAGPYGEPGERCGALSVDDQTRVGRHLARGVLHRPDF